MVFDVDLPSCIRETATKCGETLGEKSNAWVIALDAMIDVGEDKIVGDKYLKKELEKIEPFFNAIKKVKNDETKPNCLL
jgi:hypothetical protein